MLGNAAGYGGGDLSAIGSKRSVDWLWTWLAKPDAINADHRMPVFNIKKKERRQIVSYLSTLTGPLDKSDTKAPPADAVNDPVLVERGRGLVAKARCAACHTIKDAQADIASTCESLASGR